MEYKAPIDLTRPVIKNPDGSFSTEETVTIQTTDGYINIPTIVNGKRRTESEAIGLWENGLNPEVGAFDDLDSAIKYAKKRSNNSDAPRRFLLDENVKSQAIKMLMESGNK